MKRFWVIAPYDSTQKKIFNSVWEYDLKNGTIAIGWDELGDISKLDQSELLARYQEANPHIKEKKIITRDTNVLWSFYHKIKQGDIIVARRGTKKIVGIGTVSGSSYYNEEAGRERVNDKTAYSYSNLIPVKWEPRGIQFNRIIFSFYTMYEIKEEKYSELLLGNGIGELGEEDSAEFILEKYLEEFLISNFNKIFGGKLELYHDPEGNIGQQYPAITEDGDTIGRIDILARDKKSKDFIVIELKKGRESDVVVGQILRYLGWVDQYLCTKNEKVKGMIICKEVDPRLTYALKLVNKIIGVKRYKIDFELIDN